MCVGYISSYYKGPAGPLVVSSSDYSRGLQGPLEYCVVLTTGACEAPVGLTSKYCRGLYRAPTVPYTSRKKALNMRENTQKEPNLGHFRPISGLKWGF